MVQGPPGALQEIPGVQQPKLKQINSTFNLHSEKQLQTDLMDVCGLMWSDGLMWTRT